MSHGWRALYPGAFFGLATVLFFYTLWRWRAGYVAEPDAGRRRRSLLAAAGLAAIFLSLWLTCGLVSMEFRELRWAVPPLALLGFAGIAAGWRHGP
ncbi:MAG: hypothetical protein L0216_14790 [Planctomycetales bacterium]|nr:hypothetical protein [Planctomycetales bacterium]